MLSLALDPQMVLIAWEQLGGSILSDADAQVVAADSEWGGAADTINIDLSEVMDGMREDYPAVPAACQPSALYASASTAFPGMIAAAPSYFPAPSMCAGAAAAGSSAPPTPAASITAKVAAAAGVAHQYDWPAFDQQQAHCPALQQQLLRRTPLSLQDHMVPFPSEELSSDDYTFSAAATAGAFSPCAARDMAVVPDTAAAAPMYAAAPTPASPSSTSGCSSTMTSDTACAAGRYTSDTPAAGADLSASAPPSPHAPPPACASPCAAAPGDVEYVRTRAECLDRYRVKRARRQYAKKIRYQLRKINADRRPRIKGRFVKKCELALLAAQGLLTAAAPQPLPPSALAAAPPPQGLLALAPQRPAAAAMDDLLAGLGGADGFDCGFDDLGVDAVLATTGGGGLAHRMALQRCFDGDFLEEALLMDA